MKVINKGADDCIIYATQQKNELHITEVVCYKDATERQLLDALEQLADIAEKDGIDAITIDAAEGQIVSDALIKAARERYIVSEYTIQCGHYKRYIIRTTRSTNDSPRPC